MKSLHHLFACCSFNCWARLALVFSLLTLAPASTLLPRPHAVRAARQLRQPAPASQPPLATERWQDRGPAPDGEGRDMESHKPLDHIEMVLKTANCSYTLNPASQNFSASNGTGTVTVNTTAGCNWTALSNASWLTITAGASGSGNGTVTFIFTSNLSMQTRTGTAVTINGGEFHAEHDC